MLAGHVTDVRRAMKSILVALPSLTAAAKGL